MLSAFNRRAAAAGVASMVVIACLFVGNKSLAASRLSSRCTELMNEENRLRDQFLLSRADLQRSSLAEVRIAIATHDEFCAAQMALAIEGKSSLDQFKHALCAAFSRLVESLNQISAELDQARLTLDR